MSAFMRNVTVLVVVVQHASVRLSVRLNNDEMDEYTYDISP